MEIDQETRDKVIETHADVRHIMYELEGGREQFKRLDTRINKQDTRIRRIENAFVPVVAVVGIGTHKVMAWLKL